jgi:hypothetical protein
MNEEVKPKKELTNQDLLDRLTVMEMRLQERGDVLMDGPGVGRGVMNLPEWVPGGGVGLEGFWIYQGNTLLGSVGIVTALDGWDPDAEAPTDPDGWSLEFAVSGSALVDWETTAPVGTYETDLYDGDASADPVEPQTVYRIPMRRDGEWICRGGVFRENLIVRGAAGPSVELLRIG